MNKKIKVAIISGNYIEDNFDFKKLICSLETKEEIADAMDSIEDILENGFDESIKIKITNYDKDKYDKLLIE